MEPTTRGSGAIALRSLARGAVAASCLAACGRLAAYAGWIGEAEGRSQLLLGLALACTVAAVVAPIWNRLLARALPSLVLSLLGLAALALLLRAPDVLRAAKSPWLGAFLVGLLPLVPLGAQAARRWTSAGLAALGAAVAALLDGFVLEPRIGLGASVVVWALVWAIVELRAWDGDVEDRAPNLASALGLLLAGVAAGGAIAASRPFLLQHVPAGRAGSVVLLAASLSIGALGWLLGGVLARTLGRRWMAAIAAVLLAGGGAAAWIGLSIVTWERDPAWLAPMHSSSSSFARTALAIWIVVALPAAACGLLARGLWTRGARALAASVIGLAAGTLAAERYLLPELDAGGSFAAAAQARVRIPPLVEPNGYALNPDGARARYPFSSLDEMIPMSVWQGIPRGRERTWNRLESVEILEPRSPRIPSGGEIDLLCIGSVHPAHEKALSEAGQGAVLFLDPLPSLEERSERGKAPSTFMAWSTFPAPAVVLLSEPVLTQAGALLGTREALDALAARLGPTTTLWIWCDPRALRPEGLRSTLATWREVFPGARVHVLLDRYAGPLVGLQAGASAGEGSGESEAFARFEIVSVAAGTLRTDGAGVVTLDRLLVESEAEPGATPFDHPTADTIRALADALGLPEGHGALGVLESLALHATAQEFRRGLTPTEDRTRVVPEELDALRATLRKDPAFEPAVRHCEGVAGYLYKKREYDLLLSWMRDLSALRPDVGAFHRYLGLALLELLDTAGALAEMELAVSLAPESADARAELSKMYSDAGRHAEALRLLESVWKEQPTVEIAKGLGLCYLAVGDFAHARQYLEYARARAPHDGDVAHALEELEAGGR